MRLSAREERKPVPEDALTSVHSFVDAFNKGDVKGMAACCVIPMSILDGLAPHVWHGPTACEDWFRDVLIAGERELAGDYLVILGRPWRVDVSGDHAYVVIPATMRFTVKGNQVTQSGSVFTLALRRIPAGWRIAAWAWAKGTQ